MRSRADHLVTACYKGDLVAAAAAVAEGADVNAKGENQYGVVWLPLGAAVYSGQPCAVVAWLLAHGAVPNRGAVMCQGAVKGTPAVFQLLIDAGGDVNRRNCGFVPLYWVTVSGCDDNLRVLLALPLVELTMEEQRARAMPRFGLVTQEVRGVSDVALTLRE